MASVSGAGPASGWSPTQTGRAQLSFYRLIPSGRRFQYRLPRTCKAPAEQEFWRILHSFPQGLPGPSIQAKDQFAVIVDREQATAKPMSLAFQRLVDPEERRLARSQPGHSQVRARRRASPGLCLRPDGLRRQGLSPWRCL